MRWFLFKSTRTLCACVDRAQTACVTAHFELHVRRLVRFYLGRRTLYTVLLGNGFVVIVSGKNNNNRHIALAGRPGKNVDEMK